MSTKLGTCAGFCECYKVPHRKQLCTGDNWRPLDSEEGATAPQGFMHEWDKEKGETIRPLSLEEYNHWLNHPLPMGWWIQWPEN